MKTLIYILSILLILGFVAVNAVWAAVGCELNDPDRDIKRLFPDSTGYKAQLNQLSTRGGFISMMEFKLKLGDELDPNYESADVPHTTYQVLRGNDTIGYVFGINQKGTYGGMQIILATDTKGVILNWYYQRLSRNDDTVFRADSFRKQFIGLSLKDFYNRDLVKEFKSPSTEGYEDYKHTIRGIRKDLIYFDTFVLNRYYDQYIPR
jgi:hypothetical protein